MASSTKSQLLSGALTIILIAIFQGCLMDQLDNGPECFTSVTTLDASGVNTYEATLNASYIVSARQGTTLTEACFFLAKNQGEKENTNPEWKRYEASKVFPDSLLTSLDDLEPGTEYIYYASVSTNTETEPVTGEYKFFTTAILPEIQVTTVTTEGVTKQGDYLYRLHGAYELAGKDILSGIGFKYWVSAVPETVYDQKEAIRHDEEEQFTENITVSVLDVEYSYYAYITVEGNTALFTGDTLQFTPTSKTVVTTDKYEITAPGIVELYGSYVLGGDSEASETGFYLWQDEELLGAYPVAGIPDDGSIYLETDFIDYQNAHYQFMAYLKHTDDTEATGEKLDILFTGPPAPLPVSEKPTIDDVYDTDTEITGTGVAGAEINVIFPGGTEVTVVVNKNGKWQCAVPQTETLVAGQIIAATQTEPDKLPSEQVTTIILTRDTPLLYSKPPVINEVYNTHTEITGTGIAASEVTVIFAPGEERKVVVDRNNNWQCAVPVNVRLIAGESVLAYQTEPEKEPSIRVAAIILQAQSAEPTIDDVYTTSIKITGTGIRGATVTVTLPNGTEETVVVNQYGRWEYAPSELQDAGETILAYQTEEWKSPSGNVETIVKQEVSAVPVINEILDTATRITGTGILGATVTVILPNRPQEEVVVNVVVNQDGTWEYSFSGTLVFDDKVKAYQTEWRKSPSQEVEEYVTAISEQPHIYEIRSGAAEVIGTGVPGSLIKVIFPDGTEAETEVQSDGNWLVNVPATTQSLRTGQTVLGEQTESRKKPSTPTVRLVGSVS